jgi:hypothetical protein
MTDLFHTSADDLLAERAKGEAELLQRQADAPLKPRVPQELGLGDLPLFGDQASQLDLEDIARKNDHQR